MSAEPLFGRIALIGFGLIGGSIARAARAQGLAGEIVATARSPATRARVQELDPRKYLSANDSYGIFSALGDLVVTGPTRTNVNDYRAILIA